MDELNLGNMIESSLKAIERDKLLESKVDTGEEGEDEIENEEDDLFKYDNEQIITDKDYEEYFDQNGVV